MIDSGASCHMTCDSNLIHEVKKIQSIPLCLPNGTIALAKEQGTLVLEGKGPLKDV